MLDRKVARVDFHRVGRFAQWRHRAFFIHAIAFANLFFQLVDVHVHASRLKLGAAAPNPGLHGGGEKDLHRGAGQHHGTDVAARHDHRDAVGDPPLLRDHRFPDLRMRCDDGDDGGDLTGLQFLASQLALGGEHAKSQRRIPIEFHVNARSGAEPNQRGFVVDVGFGVQSQPRKGTIHRTRVEVNVAQRVGNATRDRGFTGRSGPVDGNLHGRTGHAPQFKRGVGGAFAEAAPVPKTRSVFFCSACGFESARWLGRCPQCSQWNSFDQTPMKIAPARASGAARGPAVAPVRLQDIHGSATARERTGMAEFDAVLGGGLVAGSLTLVGGPPGAGKSTLLLQIGALLSGRGRPVVYVCGEESAAQVKLRAERIAVAPDLLVFAETNLRAVLDHLEELAPAALIVDSIQTVWLPESESYPGSVTQVRDCTQAVMEFSKRTGCSTFVVGHVTKDGTIAGPRLLEHLVDTVLYFEGESAGEYRILRAYKNRFGSVDEICVFSMHEDGLREVANPSELFLAKLRDRPSGSCVVASIVGSRPVLVEVQALVGEAAYGTPRRLANNLDQSRLAMILAVLERCVGLQLGSHDVYASIAGGLRVTEPAADLGIALAIASSLRNRPLAPNAAAFGELGLSGELRRVSAAGRRTSEAKRLGYDRLFAPETHGNVAAAIAAALD